MVHQPRSSTWWHNHHHLFSTVNILPCWFRNLNRNHLSLPLRFQRHLRSTHDVYTHHMNSIQHFLVTRIFTDNTMDIFRFASVIQSFTQQWSRTSMCFGVCCYYRCTVYELWWTRRKNWKLAVSNLKRNVSPSQLLSVLFNIPTTSLSDHNKYRFCGCVLSPWIFNVKRSFFPGLMEEISGQSRAFFYKTDQI